MTTVFAREVKAARAGQGLDGAGVEGLIAQAADEVGEVFEGAVGFALRHDGAGGAFADALDGAQAEADGVVLDDWGEIGV